MKSSTVKPINMNKTRENGSQGLKKKPKCKLDSFIALTSLSDIHVSDQNLSVDKEYLSHRRAIFSGRLEKLDTIFRAKTGESWPQGAAAAHRAHDSLWRVETLEVSVCEPVEAGG